jgi:autotransporter-associated beta strand protein
MGLVLRSLKCVTRSGHRKRKPRQGTLGRFPHHRRLRVEILEGRLALTGTIAVTSAFLVNGSYQPLSTVNSGEEVWIQVNFTTQNLPSTASYSISFTVNGLIRYDNGITWGAGASGVQSWTCWWGPFIATPGTNQATVIVDSNQSVETTSSLNTSSFTFNAVSPQVSGSDFFYSVAQIRAAYGINSIPNFGAATSDGSGQTIALDEVGNDPTVLTDLDIFDEAMGLTTNPTPTLYQLYGPASSFVTVYNQSGVSITANIGTSGSNGVPIENSSVEEALDVEWAHAMAPGARIDIIEVNDNAQWETNLLAGDALAASLPGVSVVSNCFGLTQWSGETAYDSSTFVTPDGHTGVTFLTASNDNGANVYPSTGGGDGYYPATSPNVVSVGGTLLTLNNDGYGGETGWSFPAPASTVDNGTSSYAQTGSWVSIPGGFSGTYSTAPTFTSSSASWTIAVTSANTGWGTEVSATWTANPDNATNATYTIYDGTQASGTILGTVVVNQAEAPLGTADGGSQFQELGVFFPTLTGSDGTLTVVLSAQSANGAVVADAVGAAPAWASTGGPALFEPEPAYQLPFQSTGFRTTPDVSFDASQNSGFYCMYVNGRLNEVYGTSIGCPCWAGLIAIANQGLVAEGGTTLNGPANPMQTLQALYSLPAGDFNDITSGYNGFSAGPGYDEVTGRGTPIANLLIPDLVSYALPSLSQSSVSVTPASIPSGNSATVTLVVKNADGNQATTGGLSVVFSVGAGSIGSGTFGAVVDNGNGTYSALFTGTTAGSLSIAATIDGQAVTSTAPALIVLAPTVTAVSTSEMAGAYPAGTVIPVTLTFNKPVTVSGTPQLALNAGGGATASYSGGSGTSALTFSYTVGAGQNSSDLDYASIAALGLNGGSIQDANGNAAVLTLPATGSDGLATADIVVDTATLTVTAADWASAGLTLLLDASGNVHVYTTGTTTDVVAPLPLATLPNIAITSPGGSSCQLTVDSTNGDPVPAGDLNYSGAGGLIITGPGTVALSGTNTYTGGTTVSSGTLCINAADALPNDGGLAIGAGATVILDPSSVDPTVAMASTMSIDTTTATTSDAIATTALPGSASPTSSSLILLTPTAADVSLSGSAATPGAVGESAGDSLLRTSASAATLPVAWPLRASVPVPQTNDPGKSALAGAWGTPAADPFVGSSNAKRAAGALAWLGQAANSSDNLDQQRKKDVATLALEAVFAQYGQ